MCREGRSRAAAPAATEEGSGGAVTVRLAAPPLGGTSGDADDPSQMLQAAYRDFDCAWLQECASLNEMLDPLPAPNNRFAGGWNGIYADQISPHLCVIFANLYALQTWVMLGFGVIGIHTRQSDRRIKATGKWRRGLRFEVFPQWTSARAQQAWLFRFSATLPSVATWLKKLDHLHCGLVG